MRAITDPRKIEAKSFAIINKRLADIKLPDFKKQVIRRVIHASADLTYAKNLIFHPRAIKAGLEAIQTGKNIIADSSMVRAGINAKALSGFDTRVICAITDKDIIRRSSELKITRAILAMRKSARMMEGAIVAIGNAPTALFTLCDLVKEGKAKPALIVGVPVGFVGAIESKKLLTGLKIPYITNTNRKGGSSVAAAIVNALLKLAEKREGLYGFSKDEF